MSSMSNYLENALLDHSLGTTPLTAPTVYLSLYTSDPTDADSGTEVSGNGYARQAVTFGSSSSGVASNTSQETFTASGGAFGTVTHFGIHDAATTGNLLYHTSLAASKAVADGESLVVPVAALDVTFT